jgi:hypothetical protein
VAVYPLDLAAGFLLGLVGVYLQDPVVDSQLDPEAVCLPDQAVDSQPAPAGDFRLALAVGVQLDRVAVFQRDPVVDAQLALEKILIPGTVRTLIATKLWIIKSTRWKWGLWADPDPINPYDWRRGER